MGRLLGSHDTDDLDRPDLNKCPECGSYFAPSAEYCPICSAFCPEEYRAGNRKPVRVRRQTYSRASSRVTFVEWYHSWWFIALAMLLMPMVGVILLITSPHKNRQKLMFVAAALLYTVLVSWGVGGMLIGKLRSMEQPAVTELSEPEYMAACEIVDTEDFYRQADGYITHKVAVSLVVRQAITSTSVYEGDLYPKYYLCSDEAQTFTVLVRDCRTGERTNFLPGDTVLFWGEGMGNLHIMDTDNRTYHAPCLDAAFAKLKEEISS